MSEKSVRLRILVGAMLMGLAMAGLGSQVAYLHLGPHEEVLQKISRTREYEKTILAGRGRVLDCNGTGNILALNLSVKNVCVDPFVITQSRKTDEVASGLTMALPTRSRGEIASLIESRPEKRFARVEHYLPEERARRIGMLGLPGVFFEDAIIRYYPQKDFMCHVLGFVNYEGTGSAGVELALDSLLKGKAGLIRAPVDARRREVRSRRGSDVPPEAGADIMLTLDQNIQYIVEKALDEAVAEYHPRGAWAIVQRVRTGEILAMASRPSFDPNEFREASQEMMRNRAIGDVYEPGSTLKAITIASAIEAGTVTPNTTFNCENGCWYYKGRPLRDHGSGYGVLTVADGLKKSSNVLAAKVALTLGDARFEQCLRAFGIGSKLGLDLQGEEAGILHPAKRWSGLDATRIAIGQSVSATALQVLGVYCAIANDGYLMRPYVVSHCVSEDGTVLKRTQPQVLSRPISARTAATMRMLLARVTEEGGTGTRGAIEGFKVAGKTGTAQKPENGGYSATRYIASFVGFVPAEDPQIGVIVVVDEPRGERYYGGQVAAPVFARIGGQTLRYLDVNPGQDVTAPSVALRR